MKDKENITYRILFYVLMVFLFLGIIQEHFHVFRFKELLGVYVKTEMPQLTFEDYVSGEFQSQTEKYVAENFGFREPVIRLYNQYVYDFFKKTYNKEIYIGKDGWLYQRDDYVMYYGLMNDRFSRSNEAFESQLSQETRSLSKINQILKEFDVNFLVFALPTKSYVYPEHLRRHDFGDTTFNATRFFGGQLQDAGVPYIDMTPWFCAMQDTIPFSLFYEQGSHWASGTAIAVDSVLRYLEQLNGEPLAHIELGEPYSSTEIDSDDCNLGDLLNLAFPPKQPIIYDYPVRLKTDENTTYPDVFFIGTSFYWYMTARTPFDSIFSSRVFSYYNQTYFYNRDLKCCSVNEADILYELLSHDDVVYFKNGPQLYNDGFHFFGKALIALCISDDRFKEKTNLVADSLMEVNHVDESHRPEFLYKAKMMLYCNPEMFEELRGTEVPTVRNPRIQAVKVRMQIEKDREWSFLLNCRANYDSVKIEKLFRAESENVVSGKPLLKDHVFINSYEYFDNEVQRISDSLSQVESVMDSVLLLGKNPEDVRYNLYTRAIKEMDRRIENREYDNDSLMLMACVMRRIAKDLTSGSSYDNVVKKASEKNRSIEKQIREDIIWIMKNKGMDKYLDGDVIAFSFDLYKIEHGIRVNDNTMSMMKEKSKEQGIPLDVIISREANWTYNSRH